MFKTFKCGAGLALGSAALASAALAEPAFYDDRSTLERDRAALAGVRLNLSFGAQEPEMKLQFGAHVELDGQYEFLPAMSFTSRTGLSGLALDTMAADGDDGEGSAGGDGTLWLVGGGVLLLAAVAAGSDDSEEEFCPTGGLALLDLLECLDED